MPDPVIINTLPLADPVMGTTLYMIIIYGLIGVMFLMVLGFYSEFWQPLEPVRDFRIAARKNIPQAIVRGLNGKIMLKAVEEVANVFEAMGLPFKWIMTVPTNGQIGKVNTIDVSDDWNVVHNLDIDYTIVEIVHRWNEDRKDLTKHPENAGLSKADEMGMIYDYKSFETHLMNGDLDQFFPEGVKLPPFRIVDMKEVRRYLPVWTASHFAGHINRKVEERLADQNEEKKGTKFIIYALIAGGILLGCAGLSYLILTSMKCPICG